MENTKVSKILEKIGDDLSIEEKIILKRIWEGIPPSKHKWRRATWFSLLVLFILTTIMSVLFSIFNPSETILKINNLILWATLFLTIAINVATVLIGLLVWAKPADIKRNMNLKKDPKAQKQVVKDLKLYLSPNMIRWVYGQSNMGRAAGLLFIILAITLFSGGYYLTGFSSVGAFFALQIEWMFEHSAVPELLKLAEKYYKRLDRDFPEEINA